jgi:N-acetylglutamate synthase-like GNAT family acetyltransferase
VIPDYRDHKNGEYLFRILSERFSGQGHEAFVLRDVGRRHLGYLRHLGFTPAAGGEWRKPII